MSSSGGVGSGEMLLSIQSRLLVLPQISMQITQAVFGVFHHFELAHQLHQRNHLRRIYSTWPWARLRREGLPHEFVRTFPLIHTTDYLLRQTRFYPAALQGRFNQWGSDSLRRMAPPPHRTLRRSHRHLRRRPHHRPAGAVARRQVYLRPRLNPPAIPV